MLGTQRKAAGFPAASFELAIYFSAFIPDRRATMAL
jgi:hypothetical protein